MAKVIATYSGTCSYCGRLNEVSKYVEKKMVPQSAMVACMSCGRSCNVYLKSIPRK